VTRRVWAIAAGLLSLLLCACGLTTTDQAFDASLIREVGVGSTAVASVLPTLEAEAKQSNSFSNPQTSQDTILLFQGRLDKLTIKDIIRMANANRASYEHLGSALTKLDALASTIAADRVDPRSHQNLSAEAKKFITAWNTYLASEAGQVRSMRQLFATLTPIYNGFQAMLRTAYETTTSHSTDQFAQARTTFLTNDLPIYTRLRNSLKIFAAMSPAAEHLSQVVDNSEEARAIVAKVDENYPDGALATEFKRSS
jgi:TolA-binding protein